jgi:hypothetical protein
MSSFVHVDGREINLDQVQYIVRRSRKTVEDGKPHWTHSATLFFADDRQMTVQLHDYDGLELPGPMVAALPGYYLLSTWNDDGKLAISKLPVVAWKYDGTSMMPLTIDDDTTVTGAILCPDGQVIEPYNASWDSLDQWLRSKTEEHEEAKKEENAA